jgi:type IV pilus assembly protein PilC
MGESAQSYKWSGFNQQGQRKSGVLRAADVKDAQSELKKSGIDIISLEPHKGLFPARQKKIKVKDIVLFTRYLSTMIAAGLPIMQALDIISNDQENPSMKTLLMNLKNDIGSGKAMSETFAQYPKYFGGLYCSLIKAGEKSGTLDKILNRLATYLEKTESLKRKVKKALTYPIAIMAVAMIVSGILLIFVVPQFDKMFASFGAQLPFFTRMIVNLSDFLRDYWYIMLGGIVGFVFGLRYYLRTSEALRNRIDRWKLKMYVIGPVLQKGIIARFTRTLSTTIEAGMPIVESIKSMTAIMGNSVYSAAILKMCDDISSGHTLSVSMANTKLFPNMVIQMISIGEASGRLPEMLNKVADYYEEEVNSIVDNLSSLLEPLIMLVLGGIVGTFVVAMYLPIFKMGSLV